MVGTALATNPYWFIALGIMGVYFTYSALVEEGLMTASFPRSIPTTRPGPRC